MTSQAQHATPQSAQQQSSQQSWSVKGIAPPVREAVKEAARRSGMTIGEWLSLVITQQADMQQAARPADRPNPRDERWAEIAAHLSRLARRDTARHDTPQAPPHPGIQQAFPASAIERLLRDIAARSEQRSREQATRLAEALTGLARYMANAEERRREDAVRAATQQEQATAELTRTLAAVAKRIRRIEQQTAHRLEHLPKDVTAPLQEAALQQTQAIAAMELRLAHQMHDILRQLQEGRDTRDATPEAGQIEVEDRLARAIVDIRSRQVELARLEAGEDDGAPQQAIIERLEGLSRKLDAALRPATEALQQPELGEVLARLDRIDSRLEEDRPPLELARIEDMVRSLSENVERLHLAGAPDNGGERELHDATSTGVVDRLAEQISHLAQRLDDVARHTRESTAADGAQPVHDGRLQALETSIGALSAQLRGLPQADDASLERMARVAAREALAALSARDDAPDQRTRELRERELRASDTLDAVHSTLERIVDRLALLEEDLRARGLRGKGTEEPERRAAQALARAGATGGPGPETPPADGPENLLARETTGLTENVGFTASFIAAARRAAMAGADETRSQGAEGGDAASDDAATASRRRSLMIGLGALIAATGAAQISAALMHGAARLS
ncbi:localization factor PodJL [Pseudochelatococcus lubricantis]|uniref:Localization factor PodJL n=1 Tax=Pseudochelatococcus lubricantis TaxID=1538102 RepID=A0ABX0UUS7_9HYPH|nr:hypothetical protein [Pseudochelatococcus lubricantis]NIJ56708.1 localization factor PodJL [Pseudochelatococcus lubricantis]